MALRFMPMTSKDQTQVQQSENAVLLKQVLSNTKDYEFQNYSQRIDENIIYAVGKEIPQVFEYLDSRIIKTDYIPKSLNTKMQSGCEQSSP